MDFKHFFKMLFWLVVMAGLGIAGLVYINHSSKSADTSNETAKVIIK